MECELYQKKLQPLGGRGELLGSIFAGYVPLSFQNFYPFIVYCVANYSPHLCHFWSNVIYFTTFCLCIYLIKPSKTIILKRIHYIFVCVKFLDTKIFLTSNSRKFATPCSGTSPLASLLLGSTLSGTISIPDTIYIRRQITVNQ